MVELLSMGQFLYVCDFFFFQAEDGIRDWSVTGVQTCALPILLVTLLADVATNYVLMRTTEERIKYARENVELQHKTVKRIEDRARAGVDNNLNLEDRKSVV